MNVCFHYSKNFANSEAFLLEHEIKSDLSIVIQTTTYTEADRNPLLIGRPTKYLHQTYLLFEFKVGIILSASNKKANNRKPKS